MSRRECPELGSELLAAVSASLAVLKTHLASADPKVALRAASELTKLLSVCARHGIAVEAGPSPASRPLAGSGAPPDQPPVTADRPTDSESRATAPPAARSLPVPPPPRTAALPPGGKRLTSFLGPTVPSAATAESG